MHSDTDFDKDELETLRKLEGTADDAGAEDQTGDDDTTDQQATATAASEQDDTSKTTAATTATDTTGDATTTATTTATEPEPKADRSALRAARRSERRALETAARLEREIDELKAKVPAATTVAPDDEVMTALEADFPAVAKALKATTTQLAAVQAELAEARKTAPRQQAEDDFTPPALPENVQDAVDDIPELLTWQTTKEGQAKWALAVQADNLLRASPKWKDKPMAERLAEATRRVKAELDEPAADPSPKPKTKPRTDPAAAVKEAKRDAPVTLSDLRGGVATEHTQRLSRADMESMDDDALLSALG